MIEHNKTQQEFGYDISILSQSSNKKIYVKCDYCKNIYVTTYKIYNKGRSVVEKDSCKKCRYKKREDISIAKYGVKNSSQRPEIRKKISEKSEGFDNKRKKTMKEKYGVENPMESAELKARHTRSVEKKYGVKNVSQLEEVRNKVKKTNLEKYGAEEFLASKEGLQKKTNGVRLKYGVDNVFQNEEIKEKIKKTNLEKYGFDHHFKDKNKAIENSKKVLETKIKNGNIKLYDGKTISEWRKNLEYSDSHFRYLINKYGFNVAKSMSPSFSYLEQVFEKWLIEKDIKYNKQFVIENRFADFMLEDYNIIVELDGLYWHSEIVTKDKNYHINKHKLYLEHGYKPFFFREDEINNKFDIIKSIISNSLGNSNRFYARKCAVVELSRDSAKKFFNENHLMGVGRGKTFALKYQDQIVSCMQIKKNSGDNYEISRFCHLLNTQVIGGFSKLTKNFFKNSNCENLRTFIDKRYGSGDYLPSLGFELKTCYVSFRWTDTKNTTHRLKFPGNSGYKNGLVKIWDCGQAKYVLNRSKLF